MPDTPAGIDREGVTTWFEANAPGVKPPLGFDLIAGGHSNLTFTVTDEEGSRWVLRRPPLGQVLATAHDMGREHRVISSLAPTDVPVPPTIGLCTDEAVTGAPFYVMGFVDGTVIRDIGAANTLTPDQRRAAGLSLVEVLARIHAVDPDASGLGDLGRKDGYIERQLKRWYGQWEKSKTRELAVVDELFERLSEAVPEQGPASIVHGDYRLDNCILDPCGDIAAVLDWEICTLGDPLADLGLLLVYWGGSEGSPPAIPLAPTQLEGFPPAGEVRDRYADLTGRDISQIDFYVAFGYWKLACIVEGVFARYIGGSMGEANREAFAGFATQVELLAELGREAVGRLP